MPRLRTTSELQGLRRRIRDRVNRRGVGITVCAGTACQASGANDVQRVIKRRLIERNLVDRIALRITGCQGFCEMGPFVVTEPQAAFYPKINTRDVPRIIDAVVSDEYVDDLLYRDPTTGTCCYRLDDVPFFAKQQRTLLGRNQHIDPIRLFDYIVQGGYESLAKVLTEYSPEGIIDEIGRSGLRGRGGAGFPTAKKWEMARRQDGGEKYVVCNADEGDPGAYMDRSILEGNPHSVLEGMAIGGLAIGATEGFVFVRHEYPLAIKHLLIAIRLAREYGLLGENILGTGVDFDVSIVKSAGAFVCGEETALIRSIEGIVGEPRQRPPFPTEKGICGRPTCINNVETWANVPIIIAIGADEFARVGTSTSTGTKVFSVVGKIKNTGLVEVPMGTSIKEIVYDIGGGPLDGGRIKAVQIGGPSGGCIPHWHFDLPIDYDSLTRADAIMGSGGMIVMDDDTCMVDVAKYFMSFLKDESCGKCFTCRKGTQRMWEILDDITEGRGRLEQLGLLEELGRVVADSSMCGLGQSAANPVLSTLHHFRDEYERHIVDRQCDAYVCSGLTGAPCQAACPVGTEAWRYAALIARGEYEEAYRVIREANPFPSVCARVCDHKCEQHCRLAATGQEPLALRALKRFVTDRVDPSVYRPRRDSDANAAGKRVAVVGAGPAGITAAHCLSLKGYRTTIFEAEDRPGGMLVSGIPAFRLPREVLQKEIDALIDENITLRCGSVLGRDFTIDGLFEDGYDAVFLALGAHRSQRMEIEGEDSAGVYPSIEFLKAWNLRGESLAEGKVGVIGGGNSALDAARVALRQPGVSEVTIFYRRTRQEMPAFEEEIEAALEEGVKLKLLVSPMSLHVSDGHLALVEFIRNELGEVDASGRRRPVAKPGSEHRVPLDTLVVAIGEEGVDATTKEAVGVETRGGVVIVDKRTLTTGRPGVFAGGDVATGPNTVIDAIAAGKRAAEVIDRYLRGRELRQAAEFRLPTAYVEPADIEMDEQCQTSRVRIPVLSAAERVHSYAEIESSLIDQDAVGEAKRCLRCDLECTRCLGDDDTRHEPSGGHG
ncbi:MAG: FAD-dependent oxidoreductase [Gemmatimonadota bacterium]|nr:MAG: FAD-dependent oxidoreductase [Gemmatimonadota bacterium]